MATLIMTHGVEGKVLPKNAMTGFSLDELYHLLSCNTVEMVRLADGRTMWIDEEGKLATPPRPQNEKATVLLHAAGGSPNDWIAGPALIAEEGEVQ